MDIKTSLRTMDAKRLKVGLHWLLGTITVISLLACFSVAYDASVTAEFWWLVVFVAAALIGVCLVEQDTNNTQTLKQALQWAAILLVVMWCVTGLYVLSAQQDRAEQKRDQQQEMQEQQRQQKRAIQEQQKKYAHQAEIQQCIDAYKASSQFKATVASDARALYRVRLVKQVPKQRAVFYWILPNGSQMLVTKYKTTQEACTEYVVPAHAIGHDLRIQHSLSDIDACTHLSHDTVVYVDGYRSDTITLQVPWRYLRISYDFSKFPTISRITAWHAGDTCSSESSKFRNDTFTFLCIVNLRTFQAPVL